MIDMKACALFVLFSLVVATTADTIGDDDSSCDGTGCSSDGDMITFSIEVEVGSEYSFAPFTIPITSVTFLNPLTQKNETIKFRDSSYPLSTGTYCNNSYFTASKNDLKPFRNSPIPIYVNYRDGSSIAKDGQDICGFVDVEAVIIGVSIGVGAIGLGCCLAIALHFLKAHARKRVIYRHVRFTNAVNDDPVLVKAV